MCLDEIDSILRQIAEPFDLQITGKGLEIEELLPESKRPLLDQLDEIHWERTREMCSKAFQVGIAVGRTIASFLNP